MRILSGIVAISALTFCQHVYAEGKLMSEDSAWTRFEFQFDQTYFNIDKNQDIVIQPNFQSLTGSGMANQYEQMDARVLYPLAGSKYKIDLGLNIRHIQGNANLQVNGATIRNRYNEVIPAFYADASLNLPYKGLSAGFEGSHDPLNQFIDYRAKLDYQWRNSLGVQGGWKHQQVSFDFDEETQTRFTSEGPYIDFYWRF